MHSTKSIGLLIFFLINTFLFHFLFQVKSGYSHAAVWIASAAFGLIAAGILHVNTQVHDKA
jgi:regulatory protein YycI of two-component signal transduction system YycFG